MITVTDLVQILGVSDRRIRALIAQGRIQAQKMGKTWIITDYADARIRKPGNPEFIAKKKLRQTKNRSKNHK